MNWQVIRVNYGARLGRISAPKSASDGEAISYMQEHFPADYKEWSIIAKEPCTVNPGNICITLEFPEDVTKKEAAPE